MTQEQRVPFFYEVLPALAAEWQQDSQATLVKFRQFIRYHLQQRQPYTASLYRAAAAQLIHGYGVHHINGLGFDENRLKEEVGA